MSISSEKRQRELSAELVGGNLEAEAIPLSFPLKSGGEEMRAAAMAYIPNLVGKIESLLEQNSQYVATCSF